MGFFHTRCAGSCEKFAENCECFDEWSIAARWLKSWKDFCARVLARFFGTTCINLLTFLDMSSWRTQIGDSSSFESGSSDRLSFEWLLQGFQVRTLASWNATGLPTSTLKQVGMINSYFWLGWIFHLPNSWATETILKPRVASTSSTLTSSLQIMLLRVIKCLWLFVFADLGCRRAIAGFPKSEAAKQTVVAAFTLARAPQAVAVWHSHFGCIIYYIYILYIIYIIYIVGTSMLLHDLFPLWHEKNNITQHRLVRFWFWMEVGELLVKICFFLGQTAKTRKALGGGGRVDALHISEGKV